MSATDERIKEKIGKLESDLSRFRERADHFSKQAETAKGQIDLLRDLLAEPEQVEDHSPTLNGKASKSTSGTLAPAAAVRQFLRDHPGSARITIIANVAKMNLESTVPVEERDRRRALIASVLKQQLKRKKVRQDSEKLYYLSAEESMNEWDLLGDRTTG